MKNIIQYLDCRHIRVLMIPEIIHFLEIPTITALKSFAYRVSAGVIHQYRVFILNVQEVAGVKQGEFPGCPVDDHFHFKARQNFTHQDLFHFFMAFGLITLYLNA